MTLPVSQMFEHALTPVKGWFDLHSLDKTAPLDRDVLAAATVVPAGRVAYLSPAGAWRLADPTGDADFIGTEMPAFLFQGSHDNDVYNDGVSTTGVTRWVAVGPTGAMTGLVATGGYELQTTEFDTTLDYLPNQLLTATTDTDGLGGLLTNANVIQYTTWVCGVTSWHVNQDYQGSATSPTGLNAHHVQTLTFWTYFLPAAPAIN